MILLTDDEYTGCFFPNRTPCLTNRYSDTRAAVALRALSGRGATCLSSLADHAAEDRDDVEQPGPDDVPPPGVTT